MNSALWKLNFLKVLSDNFCNFVWKYRKVFVSLRSENETIKEVAKSYGEDWIKLKEYYRDIMNSNFLQDLHDIARENEDDLKC